jgi:hypothetical protein
MAVVIPMTVLVIMSISCRFYSRTVLIYTLGWDDWTMFAAAVSPSSQVQCVIANANSCCLSGVTSCS